MSPTPTSQSRVASTYNAAADAYDDPANTFWDRFGRRTIDRLALAPGDDVLDVCCGSGASAIPAAQAVGSHGSVLGIDLAHELLAIARRKADALGLANIAFRDGDLLDPGLPASSFDAVVCVFGIFFVPDMAAAVRSLWRLVRPGGRLAITTWGPRFFEPGSTAFWDAVRAVAPELHKDFNPWDRIVDPPAVRALLAEAGIARCDVLAEAGRHPIPSPQAWWSAVRGSGYRGTLERLDASGVEQVRTACLRFIEEADIRSVEANVVYALAQKPKD